MLPTESEMGYDVKNNIVKKKAEASHFNSSFPGLSLSQKTNCLILWV